MTIAVRPGGSRAVHDALRDRVALVGFSAGTEPGFEASVKQ
jgi:hypothetical protein